MGHAVISNCEYMAYANVYRCLSILYKRALWKSSSDMISSRYLGRVFVFLCKSYCKWEKPWNYEMIFLDIKITEKYYFTYSVIKDFQLTIILYKHLI